MSSTYFDTMSDPQLMTLLMSGGVGVLRTDTLYGLVCSIDFEDSVEQIYKLRGRDQDKPCIILAANSAQLMDIPGIDLAAIQLAERYWPGPVSVVAQCQAGSYPYLHRGAKSLAVRVPDYPELQTLLEAVGPIIAPSANPQGQAPARDTESAKAYFADHVDFYCDDGPAATDAASTIIRFDEDGLVATLRPGPIAINENGEVA